METLPEEVGASHDGSVSAPRASVLAPKALGAGFAWVIVELAPDGILVSDDDGEIVMANRRVAAMFGYDRDVLIGARVESLLPVRSRAVHREHRARYAEAPRTRPMGAGIELSALHADGTEFPVEISLSAVAADHGPVTVVVVRELQPRRVHDHEMRVVPDTGAGFDEHSHDQVITQLFGTGLTVAAVLGGDALDDGIARRLREVLDQLDNAIHELRRIVCTQRGSERLEPVSAP